MKLAIFFATTQAALVNYDQCDAQIGPQETANADVQCNGKTCKFKGCDQGYHRLKTTNKATAKNAKCKYTPKTDVFEWTKNLYSCRTCSDLNPLANNSEFDINCSWANTAGYQLKKCTFQCKNGEKIKPFNKKKMTNIMCKCQIKEDDNQCHWSKGSTQYDRGDEVDFSNWKCGLPENIPSGLQCNNWQGGNWANDAEKIIGGVEAKPHSWPFIASIQTNGAHFPFCGGTILDNKTVLTAAHCCDGENTVTVSLGDHYVDDDDVELRFVIPKGNILMHPAYDDHMIARDICLLKLADDEEIPFGPTIQPACLPNEADDFTGQTCWTAGWGDTFAGFPNELREVDIDIFPMDKCINLYNEAYNEFAFDQSNMFCAGKENGGKDACQGDSGGPVICADNGKPIIYGVTSWGYGCAEAEHPGVYATVNAQGVYGWIVAHMG